MKISEMPEWVLKFKKPGYTIRKNGNGFALIKISSHRVKGFEYPQLEQQFIGILDEQKGLIEKKTRNNIGNNIEYGLSHIIYINFYRILHRTLFNSGDTINIIKLGIVYYLFNSIELRFLQLCYLTINNYEVEEISKKITPIRLKKIKNKIDECLKAKIDNDEDYNYLIQSLRLIVVSKDCVNPNITFPDNIIDIMSKYGVKYE